MSRPVPMLFPSIHMGSAPEFMAGLQRKKEIVSRLCAALHEYLSFDIEAVIEQASRPIPKPPRPTIEDLNRAQEQLDLAHAQMEALQDMCRDMPEQMGKMLRITQMPQIQRWFDQMQEQVSYIQKAMEEPEPDPSSPWDGSHQIGTLCARCARNYEGVEPSVPALKVALKAAGWGRDADGDHICPACVASVGSTEPSDPAAALGDPSTGSNSCDQKAQEDQK